MSISSRPTHSCDMMPAAWTKVVGSRPPLLCPDLGHSSCSMRLYSERRLIRVHADNISSGNVSLTTGFWLAHGREPLRVSMKDRYAIVGEQSTVESALSHVVFEFVRPNVAWPWLQLQRRVRLMAEMLGVAVHID
jgi:hypothetical protein